MRKRVQLFFAAAAIALLSLLSPASTTLAQSPPSASSMSTAEMQEILRRGRELEVQDQWGEALGLYEEALRKDPQMEALRERHDFVKVQYDLRRRYGDQSFTGTVRRVSENEAALLYSEVLLKIQSHYVEQPSWRRLVDRGTWSLDIALGNNVFLRKHELELNRDQRARFLSELRDRLSMRMIRDRHDARDAVVYAGRFAQQRLGLPSPVVIMEYLCATTNSLDDYSTFLTEGQLDDLYSQIDGNFVGLGIELKAEPEGLAIVRVIPKSPAQGAGIRAGDRILSVDGQPTQNLTTEAAGNMLAGEEGSVADLTLLGNNGETRRVRVRRSRVEVPSIEDAKIVDEDQGIAYMRLVSFQKTTARDVDAALWKLHGEGMRSLIMDLRGNPGGLLTASVEVADKFVESGTIVSTRGRNPREDFTYPAHRSGTWRVPLVILIDGDSASASEILAGAIRDHGRGSVVGTRSYGKGSVQGIFPLARSKAGIRLTTAKFYSPRGKPYSRVGVEPDVVVRKAARPVVENEDNVEAIADRGDSVLDAAIQIARRQMARR